MSEKQSIRMRCPNCRTVARGDPAYLERDIVCPKCKTRVRFIRAEQKSAPEGGPTQPPREQSSTQGARAAESEEPPPPPGRQTHACPYCGEEILASARKCKHCGQFLTQEERSFAQHVKTDVKQGAVIGAAVCFVLGIVLMLIHLMTFILYGPLFLASFVLSIVAMAQRRIIGGLAMLLLTLIVPPVLGAMIWGHALFQEGAEEVSALRAGALSTAAIAEEGPTSLLLNETRVFGNLAVTPLGAWKAPLSYMVEGLFEKRVRRHAEPVLLLALRVENRSEGQVFAPAPTYRDDFDLAEVRDNYGNRSSVSGICQFRHWPLRRGGTQVGEIRGKLSPGERAVLVYVVDELENPDATDFTWELHLTVDNQYASRTVAVPTKASRLGLSDEKGKAIWGAP